MRTLSINSKDRLSTSSSSTDFKIKVDDPLILNKLSKVQLHTATIVNTIYVITSDNNSFIWEESTGGGPITSTLTNGFYTPQTFATMLKGILDTDTLNSQVYTITFDQDTDHLTISTTANFIVYFSQTSSLANIMGFATSDTTAATSITSTEVTDFAPAKELLIEINLPASTLNFKFAGNRHNVPSFIIQNSAAFTEILYYRNTSLGSSGENEHIYDTPTTLPNMLQVRLLDQDYNLVSLNGKNWMFSLHISD